MSGVDYPLHSIQIRIRYCVSSSNGNWGRSKEMYILNTLMNPYNDIMSTSSTQRGPSEEV